MRTRWAAIRRRLRPVRRAARRAKHAGVRWWLSTGNRVECPCCGHSFRSFLPHGPFNRPNVKCPACGSHERHRLLWLYLTVARPDLLGGEPKRFLHFAPELPFQRLARSKPNIEYVSADLASPLAEHAVDIHDLPFRDGSFDALLCSHVLEHVEDDRRAMGELRRVLRPGGWAILMVPLHGGLTNTLEDPRIRTPEERLQAYGQADHVRLYGLDFTDRLREAGFEVKVEDHSATFPPELYQRYGLTSEKLYLCHRRKAHA